MACKQMEVWHALLVIRIKNKNKITVIYQQVPTTMANIEKSKG